MDRNCHLHLTQIQDSVLIIGLQSPCIPPLTWYRGTAVVYSVPRPIEYSRLCRVVFAVSVLLQIAFELHVFSK
jgi:hypothetical protein